MAAWILVAAIQHRQTKRKCAKASRLNYPILGPIVIWGFFVAMINEYRNAIRDLIERLKRQGDIRNVILWQVQDDEVHDPTLLSLRAFGSRGYADEVLIACGASGIWEALPKQKILLPKPLFIHQVRKKYGIGA